MYPAKKGMKMKVKYKVKQTQAAALSGWGECQRRAGKMTNHAGMAVSRCGLDLERRGEYNELLALALSASLHSDEEVARILLAEAEDFERENLPHRVARREARQERREARQERREARREARQERKLQRKALKIARLVQKEIQVLDLSKSALLDAAMAVPGPQ